MKSLRLDRIATVYLFHPLLRLLTARSRVRFPILMYHSVSKGNGTNTHPYFQTETALDIFAEQMGFLYEHNYSVMSLGDAMRHSASVEHTAKKCVVLTFDDGYRDFYTHAFPILSKYGFTATVFLPTAYIADPRRRFKNRDCLTWTEVRDLHKAGVIFGSHTVTHPQLKFLKAEELEPEVRRSKETIENELGYPIDSFSYPFAFPETVRGFKERLKGLLEEHGYKNGVSTIVGTAAVNDDNFFLRRLPVNSWDDRRLFRAKLEGGYDWLRPFQYAAKLAKFGVS